MPVLLLLGGQTCIAAPENITLPAGLSRHYALQIPAPQLLAPLNSAAASDSEPATEVTLQIAQDGTVTPARKRPPLSMSVRLDGSAGALVPPSQEMGARPGMPMSTPMAGDNTAASVVPHLPLDGKSALLHRAGVGAPDEGLRAGGAAPAHDGQRPVFEKAGITGHAPVPRPLPDAKVPLSHLLLLNASAGFRLKCVS